MIDEILGFHEPVITQRQEALPASAAPRQGTAQKFGSLLYIVSADAHYGKCANETFPKSKYGSLLKGCRR